MSYIVAADTGGTFTDLAVYDTESASVRYAKNLTTYDDLVQGVMNCINKADVELMKADIVKLGTTLAINTFVMRSGARTALITTEGFRDVLELRRGNRSIPFDLRYTREPPLVSRDLRFEVSERMAADGSVITPLDVKRLTELAGQLRALKVEAVAVSFLNSYVNSEHEDQAVALLRKLLPDLYVTAGTEISHEWYEFERTSTAAANAYVGPKLKDYVSRLADRLIAEGFSRNFFLMASNGGVFSRQRSEQQPVMLVESGPVGGCIGAGVYANALGLKKVIAFDMGGTTAKCAIVENGQFEVKSPYYIGGVEYGFPVRGGVLDIVEVGAGGGSIAWLDEQQRLNVGPRSAGSNPGPVSYGRGGAEPTITDANLLLGRIAASFLGGEMQLDRAAAEKAMRERIAEPLGFKGPNGVQEVSQGVISLGSMIMANAIKRITIERGLDPRDFSLFVFGGGGPLHGATLAREMNIPEVIVPPHPGVFSALGMLLADARVDETRTFLRPLAAETVQDLAAEFSRMEAATTRALTEEVGSTDIVFERHAEMRYRGQKQAIRAHIGMAQTEEAVRQAFEHAYERRYGHVYSGGPLEFVNLVLTAVARISGPVPENLRPQLTTTAPKPSATRQVYFPEVSAFVPTQVYQRNELPLHFEGAGPAVIEEYGTTTVIGPNDRFAVGTLGEIRIRFG